ncbi:MAG: 30S ribosomal protein S6 [Defluviitaleaceae bacterium]|nr:30S ribosomal protein S6 [Defluviitaleaceae bacterium]
MNRYEMGVVIRADLEDEAYRAELDRVKGFIDRFGGSIEKVDDWGKRKLAYPISKLTEGMYTFITYTSEGNTPKEVEARLRLQENILRFLTIRADESAPAPAAAAAPATPAPESAE